MSRSAILRVIRRIDERQFHDAAFFEEFVNRVLREIATDKAGDALLQTR